MYRNSLIDNKLKRTEKLDREFAKVYDKVDGNIQWFSTGKYRITSHKHGIVDFYIASNTIIVRDGTKAVKGGLKWIIENLIR